MTLYFNGRPLSENALVREDYETGATAPRVVPDGYERMKVGEVTDATCIHFSCGKWYSLRAESIQHGPVGENWQTYRPKP